MLRFNNDDYNDVYNGWPIALISRILDQLIWVREKGGLACWCKLCYGCERDRLMATFKRDDCYPLREN